MGFSRKWFILLMVIIALSFVSCSNPGEPVQDNQDAAEYLGQAPPGSTPVLFAPGIISRADYIEQGPAVFSPDKNEVYWSAMLNGGVVTRLYYMKSVDGEWTSPELAPFAIDLEVIRPVFSLDGNNMFLSAEGDIVVLERQGESWSDAEPISPVINTAKGEYIQSVVEDGSIYFIRTTDEDIFGKILEICVSRKIDGEYTEPVKLGENINTDYTREYAVYVAPDESYMIIESGFDCTSGELYICYKNSDDSWSERISLAFGYSYVPCVSPDGNYLFYAGGEGVFWVNTSFIEDLKPDTLR
ncbi:MAG: hypothetical protein GY863_18105 [bacterium]|nr:hypothetical protein [bacterium]